ncbi:hypothetical protein CVD25_10050 [Bacillus canaveralius]|uniref:Uncharacterized protein n=2 Tax=Bacillaceae TaxID=186817 RepID=A0A2N5GMD9_9BACI|nr:hypothetical protein CU635_11150 [Bacillus canaveralius]PLR87923.1 hypothetical protein CVD23_00265 [Bacillus sp. V33-4]PLR96977.1 hypothetical protein CVD25_10050 [Bacillus canaveralius]
MKKFIYPMLLSSIIISGCASNDSGSEHPEENLREQEHNHAEQEQPKLEYVIGSNDWSAIMDYTDSKEILEAYQFAVEHPEVLNYMPCYCGCYEEDGHTSNTNCFVDSVDGDIAKLDTMGFG